MKKLLLTICLLLILLVNTYSGTSAGLGDSFEEAYQNAISFKTSKWKIYNIKYIYVNYTKYRPYRCYIYWTD